MTVVNPKSISGINSITMASGSDDLLTIHSNNTTERVRVNNSGDVIIGSGVTLSPDGDIFATGITTISENLKVGTGVTISPDGDGFFTGVVTATSYAGDGSALTGISVDSTQIVTGNTSVQTVDTGSDGHVKINTEGSERLRIDSDGHLHTGYTSSFGGDHVNILATDGGGISIAQNNSGNATSGTVLGTLSFQGYHSGGATFSSAEAKISGIAAANHTGSSAATDMVLYTKPSATGPGSAPTEIVPLVFNILPLKVKLLEPVATLLEFL